MRKFGFLAVSLASLILLFALAAGAKAAKFKPRNTTSETAPYLQELENKLKNPGIEDLDNFELNWQGYRSTKAHYADGRPGAYEALGDEEIAKLEWSGRVKKLQALKSGEFISKKPKDSKLDDIDRYQLYVSKAFDGLSRADQDDLLKSAGVSMKDLTEAKRKAYVPQLKDMAAKLREAKKILNWPEADYRANEEKLSKGKDPKTLVLRFATALPLAKSASSGLSREDRVRLNDEFSNETLNDIQGKYLCRSKYKDATFRDGKCRFNSKTIQADGFTDVGPLIFADPDEMGVERLRRAR